MHKPASTSLNILDEIKNRWSPRAFTDKPVENEKLERIFEAARWSASCFNEQPWRFMVGIKEQGDAWDRIFKSLNDWNQKWCKSVSVLVLLVAKRTFTRNDKPNGFAEYDLGQVAAYISMQAMKEGLFTHQMAGFNRIDARDSFAIPDEYVLKTIMAIGYYGDANDLPDDMRKTELGSRSRRTLSSLVFSDQWDQPAVFLP